MLPLPPFADPSKIVNIAAMREAARKRLPRMVFDYIDGGAEDEVGLSRNMEAFRDIRIAPRYLIGAEARATKTKLFGRDWALPFGIAPTGMSNIAWPGADLALARAATAANIPFTLSTAASTTIEAVGPACRDHFWYQLYAPIDRSASEDMLKRARDAGAELLMVTVDVPLPAKRERDLRNGLALPVKISPKNAVDFALHPWWLTQVLQNGAPSFENLARYADHGAGSKSLAEFIMAQISSTLDWPAIDWLRGLWDGPLVLKGVMSAADAARAKDAGIDGILLSNHGGRQFDASPAPIELLPAVRGAVGDGYPIILDSGVRRGADIGKALALGADFVLIGRATLYGAAAFGQPGVERSIAILRDELDRFLAQIGCEDVGKLRETEIVAGPDYVAPEMPKAATGSAKKSPTKRTARSAGTTRKTTTAAKQ